MIDVFIAVKVTMEDKCSNLMLKKYDQVVDGTIERFDECSFIIHFLSCEGKNESSLHRDCLSYCKAVCHFTFIRHPD